MATAITIGVILAMIAVGVLVIQLLNAQHAERISAFHYSRFLPGRRGPRGSTAQSPPPPPPTPPPAGNTRGGHHHGGHRAR